MKIKIVQAILALDRESVRRLHYELNICLGNFAEARGLKFSPAGMRFDSMKVTSKVEFVLKGKERELSKQTERYAPIGCKLKVGHVVCHQNNTSIHYEITGFTRRGKVLIKRLKDGKGFRCQASALTQPGEE